MISIAIDGPSGAGKSTIARAVSKNFGYLYADTGALYRAIGKYALDHAIPVNSPEALAPMLSQLQIRLVYQAGEQHVLLNGRDVSESIRLPEVSMAASAVSAAPCVRTFLFDLQRDLAKANDIVMDGRDIGTVVLPDADVKIFLTAAAEDRALRRYEELQEKDVLTAYDEVLADVRQRDENDQSRAISPLKQAVDAILVDTTGYSLEQSLEQVQRVIREKLEKKSKGESNR